MTAGDESRAGDSPGPDESPRFNDGKAPDALRTIGEVAAALGLRQHVLRYWEEQFPTLRPLTRAGGRRYYRPDDIALLVEIDRLLHREGYTVRGARQALGGAGGTAQGGRKRKPQAAPVAAAADVLPEGAVNGVSDEENIIAALALLRSHLQSIRDRLAATLAD